MPRPRSSRRLPFGLLACGLSSGLSCLPLSELSQHESGAAEVALDPSASGAASDSVGSADAGASEPGDEGSGDSGPGGPDLAAPEGPTPGTSGSAPRFETDSGAVVAPPQLLSILPADGDLGVAVDAHIELEFSRPMDRDSVEAGFSSAELLALEPEFAWLDDDTRVEIRFATPLESALGSDPGGLQPRTYTYSLSGAADREGRALSQVTVSFATIRRIETELPAVSSSDATGNWRSDGVYGTAPCNEAGNRLCVGDSALADNERYYGFLSFDLGGLEGAVWSRADLAVQVTGLIGTPFADLGALQVEMVEFSGIGPAAFSAAVASVPALVSEAAAGDTVLLSLLESVEQRLSQGGGALQLRLRFELATDGDASTDLAVFDRTSPALRLAYAIP